MADTGLPTLTYSITLGLSLVAFVQRCRGLVILEDYVHEVARMEKHQYQPYIHTEGWIS